MATLVLYDFEITQAVYTAQE